MTRNEIIYLFCDVIDYLSDLGKGPVSQRLEDSCGVPYARRALGELMFWLRDVFYGIGSRELLLVEGEMPLEAMRRLLGSGVGFSYIFQLQGSRLTWSTAVDDDVRAELVQLVGKRWVSRRRE